jgi:hypothetical protein
MNFVRRTHLILPIAAVLLSDLVSRFGLLAKQYLGAWGDLIRNPFALGYLLIALVFFVLLRSIPSAPSSTSALQENDRGDLSLLLSRLTVVQILLSLFFGWATYQAVTAQLRPYSSLSEKLLPVVVVFIVHSFVWVASMLIANLVALSRHNLQSRKGERA